MALSIRYLQNVRGHYRWDAQAEIASGPIDLVQELVFIGRRQRGIVNYYRGASFGRGFFEPG